MRGLPVTTSGQVLLGSAVLGVAHLVAPQGATQATLVAACSVGTVAAAVATRRCTGTRTVALLAVGLLLLLGGLVVAPFPTPADRVGLGTALTLTAAAPLFAACVALRGERRSAQHRRDRLDTAILSATGALLLWMAMIDPVLEHHGDGTPHLVDVAGPLVTLALLAAVGHLLLQSGVQNRALWLLFAGFASFALSDAAGIWVEHGRPGVETAAELLRVGTFAGIGAAAAHPALRPADRGPAGPRGFGEGRLAVLSLAALLPPLLLVGLLVAGTDDHARLFVAASASLVVLGLALMRLWDLLREVRELAFLQSEHRFAAMVENATDVFAVTDPAGTVRYISPAVRRVFELTAQECVGRSLGELVHPDEAGAVGRLLQEAAALQHGQSVHATVQIGRGEREHRFAEVVVANLLADDAVAGLVVTVGDVTERTILERELSHQAFHDGLTGLANRALFVDRVDHALRQRIGPDGEHVSVLFVDLDDFKSVNDGMGHHAGDELLRAVARRITSCTRGGDTVARLGGDEFAVLLETDGKLDRAVTVAERILEVLRLPLRVGGLELAVPASIGIATAEHRTTTDALLRDADIAMYQAKRAGKSRYSVFDSRMREDAAERLAIKADLVTALDGGELHLVYQPIVDLQSGLVSGAEALLRWSHPTRGPISPAMFVPLAEASGHIADIGRWVLFQACREAARWQQPGRPLGVGVNASGVQFDDPTFVRDVELALAEAGLAPSCLTIEITETVLMQDTDRTIRTLGELRSLGVRVAVDDFGTGYCSLAYLQRYPVDVVKIDREFVAELTAHHRGTTLAETILQMARTLGLRTVAEGIETTEQLDTLRRLGCPHGQGYRFSQPLPADVFAELITDLGALTVR